MKHLPNSVSLCNLAAGFVAVVMAFENQILLAAWLILLAVLLDFMDGFLARLLNAASALGLQLDSLADLVSFGMAPAVLMLKLLELAMRGNEGITGLAEASVTGRVLLLSPVLLLLGAAIRLAGFNIRSGKEDFRGLATPAAGIFVAGITLFIFRQPEAAITGFIMQIPVLLVCILGIGFLMVLPIPMFSLKFRNLGWEGNGIRYFFLAVSGFLLIILHEIALPVIVILYVLTSIVHNVTISK